MTAPGDPPAFIINLSHSTRRHRIPIRVPHFYIGRVSENDLCLSEDHTVSRRHCMIAVGEESLSLTDCNSTNGTYLNGNRVRGAVPLPVPALVVIGRSRLAVVATGSGDSDFSTVLKSTYSSRGSIVIPSTLRELVSAFLVVDLVGSTTILRQNAFRLASIVATLGQIMEKHMAGEIEPFLQCTGDGFFAAFSSADTAIGVATDLLPNLEKHLSMQLRLSIALHWGKSYLTGEGSRTGFDVYAVFALENLRHQHEKIGASLPFQASSTLILMTGPFHSQLGQENQNRTVPMGPYQLRGIDHPIDVFRLEEPQL